MKHSTLDRVSLLIPTKNRPDFLQRTLHYYLSQHFNGTIIIGDSSDNEILAINKETVSQLSDSLELLYLECTNLSLTESMQVMIKKVTTPYVAELHDDNFLIPGAVEQCIDYLDTHPSFSAAHGNAVSIKTANDQAYSTIKKCVAKTQLTSESPSPSMRYIHFMAHYADIHYSVQRREIYEVFRYNSNYKDTRFFNGLSQCMVFIAGKVKHLDSLYLVRQIQSNPTRGQWDYFKVLDWMSNPHWAKHKSIFVTSAAKYLSETETLGIEDATATIEKGLLIYFGHKCIENVNTTSDPNNLTLNDKFELSIVVDKSRFLSKVFRRICAIGGWCLETIRHKLFGAEPLGLKLLGRKTKYVLPSLLAHGSKYHSAFLPVYTAITSDHRNIE